MDYPADSRPPSGFEALKGVLETVPDGLFEDLRTVEEIYLSGNLLNELPDGMFDGQTANLSVLDLSANGLETLPEGVLRNLAGLVSLSLAGNGLAHLPGGLFDDLVELDELDLSANSIDELPDGLFDGNIELRDLDLSINEISELPEGVFGDLGNLAELDLSGNELEDLPVGVFEGLSGLTDLGVHRFIQQRTGQPDLEVSGSQGTIVIQATASEDNRKPVNWAKAREVVSSVGYSGKASNFVTVARPGFHDVAIGNANEIAERGDQNLLLIPLPELIEVFLSEVEGNLPGGGLLKVLECARGYFVEEESSPASNLGKTGA